MPILLLAGAAGGGTSFWLRPRDRERNEFVPLVKATIPEETRR